MPEIVRSVTARAFRIPTDAPEADGTFAWNATTLVVTEVSAGEVTGMGYTYADAAAADVVRRLLAPILTGAAATAVPALHAAMVRAVRNVGRSGIAATAVSALDTALWDLSARLLGVSLKRLFGEARPEVAIYGSGGFTTYDDDRLAEQLGGYVGREGCRAVKMKVGADPARDTARMRAARAAIGEATLMIDANGALDRKAALRMAGRAAEFGVAWFEEPVSSDDRDGLRLMRDRAPAGMEIAAGEYGFAPAHFRDLVGSGAVDVLQVDASRCGGYTGFLRAAAVADASGLPVSAHTAPALHLPVCLAAPRVRHVEWFHDHARIEAMLFDGAPVPVGGAIKADDARPGHGLVLREAEARRYEVDR